jgi:hypothetical protein
LLGASGVELAVEVLEKQLDELGRQGWELVHVWFDQKLHHEKDGHLMVFKRPVFDARGVQTQG